MVSSKILTAAVAVALLPGVVVSPPVRAQDVDDEAVAEKAGSTVTTLQVVRKTPEDVQGVNLFRSPGTSFILLVDAPAGAGDIIGLDEKGTRITKATDDKGTDLVGEEGDEKAISAFFSKVGKSRKRIAIPVKLPEMPAKGATKIDLDLTVAMRVGSDAKEETVKGVKIEKGATFKIAGVDVTLGDPAKAGGFGGGNKAMSVEFTTKKPLDAIKKLTFKSPAGEDLGGKRSGSSSGGTFGSMSYSVTYDLDEKVDAVDLVVNAYQKVETIKVPVKLTVTLGL